MVQIFYGSGNCSIEGSSIRGVQIFYTGNAIKITDKTPNGFYIATKNNKIIIFPLGKGSLNNLFDYIGEFKIDYAIAVDANNKKINCTIRRLMDYPEMLGNPESITINSEDLKQGYISTARVSNTSVDRNIIKNKNSSEVGALYYKDGTEYSGKIHIHINSGAVMTGMEHSKDSETLYFKKKDQLILTKNYKPKQRKIKDRY